MAPSLGKFRPHSMNVERQFMPPWFARNGWVMTLYAAWRLEDYQSPCDVSVSDGSSPVSAEPTQSLDGQVYTVDHVFKGDGHVP
ncbi:MAG: hypothetical protein VKL39_21005, partial [Leptolyngbyaceae bacterium]|nr:hypothetical protein [Leptolyngbyaceae bacterium]